MLTLNYKKHHFWIFFCPVDKSAVNEENPWGLSHGDESSVKDSSEDVFHSDLVGRVKENILPDYTSYMTSLIFSAHASPLQSPCQSSTQGSPTEKEQVSFKQRGFVSFLSHDHVKRSVIYRWKCFLMLKIPPKHVRLNCLHGRHISHVKAHLSRVALHVGELIIGKTR